MDVFVNDQTKVPERWFYHYDVRQRDGTVTRYDTVHSTRFVTQDAVARIQAAPSDQPLFALLSVFDTHQPNIPMPEFAADPRCDAMPPWLPPSYTEDVSDKPNYVKKHAIADPDPAGFDLVDQCREMLGIDWMVGQVVGVMADEGRFDNTLFVFMADNGMTWGEHRLPDNKHTPYATRVPLYMYWRDAWGTTPRSIDEFVSDIDIAPTFCAVAGCTLGPFPGGQTQPDGLSLLPVINGAVNSPPAHLARDAILQSNFEVPWWGLRTTTQNGLGLWTYTEWANGDVELYDMTNDPWEMNNLAQEGAYASIRAALSQRLAQLRVEGQPSSYTAKVTIVQNSKPDRPRDFQYTGSFDTFPLDDDSTKALPRKRVFSNLAAGDYTVTQGKVAGWSLSSIVCSDDADVNLASRTVVIHLESGAAVTCTFKTLKIH
jgi:arylsulfatase A-like enzyme